MLESLGKSARGLIDFYSGTRGCVNGMYVFDMSYMSDMLASCRVTLDFELLFIRG